MCSGRYFGAVSLLKEETRNCICHSPAPCPDCLNGECFEACYFPRPQLHFRPSAFCALRAHPLSWFPDQLNQLFFEACCLPSSHFKIVKKSSLDMTVSVHEGPPLPPAPTPGPELPCQCSEQHPSPWGRLYPQDCPCSPLGPDTKLGRQDLHSSLPSSLNTVLSPLHLYSPCLCGEPVFILGAGDKVGWSQKRYWKVVGRSGRFLSLYLGSTFPWAQGLLPASKAAHSICLKEAIPKSWLNPA